MCSPITKEINYDGRTFVPVVVAPAVPRSGDRTPRGRFRQFGNLVRAEFSGGWLRGGSMVGVCDPDGGVEGVYCLAFDNGDLVAGRCRYEPTVLADGRLRIAEHWHRLDGSEGVSYIEEIAESLLIKTQSIEPPSVEAYRDGTTVPPQRSAPTNPTREQ